MSESVSESAPPCQIKQFQFYTYMYLLKHQTRHIHKPSPHFFPRLQDRQPKDPSQYPNPPISFLKFSVFSFLLTRHACLSHSDRREGGENSIFLCMCACISLTHNLHILCLSFTHLFLISYFILPYVRLALTRNSNSN